MKRISILLLIFLTFLARNAHTECLLLLFNTE